MPQWIYPILFIFLQSILCQQFGKPFFITPGNPGIKMRLTKLGANHIKTVGVQIFNEYVSKLKNYNTTVKYNQIGFNGIVKLSKLRVQSFNPAQLSVLNFQPPSSIVLGLENIDISLTSKFVAENPPFTYDGSFDGSLVGLTIALTSQLIVDANGRLHARVQNCSSIINRSHVVLNPNGPMGLLLKVFEAAINDSVKQHVPEILCARLQLMIERNIDQLFEKIHKINFNSLLPSKIDKNDFMLKYIKTMSDDMFIDNRMITQPLVTLDFIDTNHQGEIKPIGALTSAPFYPRPMFINNTIDNRMAHFYVTDYMLNSMLYHAYQENRLSIKIEKTNSPKEFRSLIATTCPTLDNPTTVCVGSLIDPIGKAFPNSTVSFIILPHGLPQITFDREGASIETNNRVLVYVNHSDGKPKSQILVFSINGQAEIEFMANEESIEANMTLNKFNVRLHRSAVRGIYESSINRLSPLVKTFISPRLNKALAKAIKLPMQETVRFIRPTINTYDGFMKISTDFKLNPKHLKKFIEPF